MDITKTLHPGDMGTKRLYEQYGNQLVCVRYRVDKLTRKRFTTVELIVDEKPIYTHRPIAKVLVKVLFEEMNLRQKIKQAGGKWLAEEKAWEIDYETAKKLRLKKRIVKRLDD